MSLLRSFDAKKEQVEEKVGLRGFTIRAVITGISGIALVAAIVPSGLMFHIRPSFDTRFDVPRPSAIACMLLLIAMGRLFKRIKYNRSEVVTVFGMVYVGGLLATNAFVAPWITNLMHFQLRVLEGSARWQPWVERLSGLLFPKDNDTVVNFWLGNSLVPWKQWICPVIISTAFAFVFFFTVLCVVVMVRRHWTDREHLSYPLARVILSLAEEPGSKDQRPSFWEDRLSYLGMLVPVVVLGIDGLATYLPTFPYINLWINLAGYVPEGGLLHRAWSPYPGFFFICDNFMTIGIGYLIPTSITFSTWFTYFFYRGVVNALSVSAGYFTSEWLEGEVIQTVGAQMGLGLGAIWLARHDVRVAIGRAFTRCAQSEYDDSNEPLPVRVAVLGFVVGVICLVWFGVVFLQVQVWYAFAYLFIFISLALGYSRFRAEAGLPLDNMFGQDIDLPLKSLLGKAPSSEQATGLQVLPGSLWFSGMMYGPFSYGAFGIVPAQALDQYKMADETGMRRKSMTAALLIAVVVGVVLAFVFVLPVIYDVGGYKMDPAFKMADRAEYWAGLDQVFPGKLWVLGRFFGTGIGVTFLLMYLRTKFLWWPFHPIGYVVGIADSGLLIAGHFFIAWVIKVIVMRYGGAKFHSKSLPFFMGMIAGYILMKGFWAVVAQIVSLF